MADNKVECPICGSLSDRSFINAYLEFYKCTTCHRYAIGYDYANNLYRDKFASYLFYKTIMHTGNEELKNIFYFIGTENNFKQINQKYDNAILVKIEDVENWFPNNFSEKIDYILLGLERFSPHAGKSISIFDEMINCLFFIQRYNDNGVHSKEEIDEQVNFYYTYLIEQEYIKKDDRFITLLPKSLKRIDELQKYHINNKQVFVAMSFAENMKAVQENIEISIRKAGYVPCVMNKIEHNNQIVPEILYQIRQSKFVIAEFTTRNNGAYYEAGYALALGKQVIHVCKRKAFMKKGHFDIKQISTVLWNTEDEIVDALYNRIISTIK